MRKIRDNVLYSLCRDIVFLCFFLLFSYVFVFSLFCTTRLVNKVVCV